MDRIGRMGDPANEAEDSSCSRYAPNQFSPPTISILSILFILSNARILAVTAGACGQGEV